MGNIGASSGINNGSVLPLGLSSGLHVKGAGSTPSPAFEGLLDTYTGAVAAYAYIWLNGTYSGPLVELRRSSDNATEDFYPDGDDILSLTSESSEGVTLATWVGANDAYVRTAYDQTGNAAHWSSTTTSRQPKIITSGALEVDANGNVVAYFDGSLSYLQNTFASSVSDPSTFVHVTNTLSVPILGSTLVNSNDNVNDKRLWYRSPSIYRVRNGGGTEGNMTVASGAFIQSSVFENGTNFRTAIDGGSVNTLTVSGASTATGTTLGDWNALTRPLEMEQSLFIVFDSDIGNTDLLAINSSINDIYSHY